MYQNAWEYGGRKLQLEPSKVVLQACQCTARTMTVWDNMTKKKSTASKSLSSVRKTGQGDLEGRPRHLLLRRGGGWSPFLRDEIMLAEL